MSAVNSQIEADVVVVGAGSAGVAAAVAAAESGARTVLVESTGHIGGTLAWQLLEHSAGFHNVGGDQLVGGFGQRLVDVLQQYGASPGHVRDDVGYTATRTPVNHAELAMAESRLLRDAGVRLLLNAPVVAAVVADGRVVSLDAVTAEGVVTVAATTFVDASGDAVLAAKAGAGFQSDLEAVQPASLLFKVAGIDFAELLGYARAHPEDFRDHSIIGSADDAHVNLWGFGAILEEGWRSGVLSLRRTEMHLAGWPRRGEAIANVTRVPLDGLGAEEVGASYLALQSQLLEFARWFRESVPGAAESYISAVGDRLGVRESRRIRGVQTLTAEHIAEDPEIDDSIGYGAFPIDIHDARSAGLSHTDAVGAGYRIPYGVLVSADIANLLAAGRCVSSTHEGNGSVRITATCFVTGEAAGTAAAIASLSGVRPADLDVAHLQRRLRERGVVGAWETVRGAGPAHVGPLGAAAGRSRSGG